MSKLSTDKATLHETAAAMILAGVSNVSAPATLTSASGAVTITYTTDNPNITANGAVVIADGDNVSDANNLESLVELDVRAAAMYTDLSALRTAVTSLISGNVFDAASLPAMTAAVPSAVNQLIGVSYTTDNPSITPNNAITIADGDNISAANLHEMFVELNKEAYLLWNDLSATYTRAKQVIDQKSFQGVRALPALTSNVTMVAITYTTDNPSITPNGAVTIADGDVPTKAAMWELAVEIRDQLMKQRADLLAVYTAFDSMLDKVGAV